MSVTHHANTEAIIQTATELHDLHACLPAIAALFDLMPDNVILHDAQGTPVYVSRALMQDLEISSLTELSACFSPAQREEYYQQLKLTMETHRASQLVCHFDHGKFSLDVNSIITFYPIINQQAQLIGVLGHSYHQALQQQVQEISSHTQKAYMRSLLDGFPFPIWMKNRSGMFVSVNRQFCKEFGFDHPRDVLGKNDFDLFDAEMAQQFRADDEDILQTGLEKRVVEKIRKADGTLYWGYTHKTAARTSERVIGTVGFTRDVSEERRLQVEIAELENEYALLMNSIPIAIMVYDMSFRRILVNDYYSKLIRTDGRAFLGKTPAETWSPYVVNLSADEYMQHMHTVIATGEPVFFDMIHTRDASGHSTHDVRLIPRRNKDNVICGVIAIVQDVSMVHESRLRNEHQAHHDALTGLPNRILLAQKLEEATSHARRANEKFAFLMLDLDGFKSINDSMGHDIGDKLLQEVAQRLQTLTPDDGFCCRLGGDEFAMILRPMLVLSQAKTLASHCLQSLHQSYLIDQVEYYISASIGIAVYPDHTANAEDLIRFADTALYAAKDGGRNTWCCYDVSFTHQAERRFHVANALRTAISQQALTLVFQPIINMSDRRIHGVEALCRWRSKTLGVVSPAEFIPIAEHTGLMLVLGKTIMADAFDAAYQINHRSNPGIRVSVNVSARQFNDPKFVEQVSHLLLQHQCQPQWIKLEITESLLLEYSHDVLIKLNQLTSMGILIALDDFGTGHSALSYLFKFPLQQIKIDRSFIQDIELNPTSAKLIKAIIAMVGSMEKELVAEGVETEKQAELLQQFGCHMAQGFFYSTPLTLESLLSLAHKQYTL